MNIHPCFKTEKVLSFVAHLILECDYKDFNDLSEDDLKKFASLLIEADKEAEFLTQHAFADLLMEKFVLALATDKPEANEDFLWTAKDHAVEYYDSTMRDIFKAISTDHRRSCNEWADYIINYGNPDQPREVTHV